MERYPFKQSLWRNKGVRGVRSVEKVMKNR